MHNKTQSRKSALIGAGAVVILALALGGCGYSREYARIKLAAYAPVIDVQGQGYDVGTYFTDLAQCRRLSLKVQAAYDTRRREKQARALKSAEISAAIGNADNSGRIDEIEADVLYRGSQIGATGLIARFGPTAIVDNCMTDRGYEILLAEGISGG